MLHFDDLVLKLLLKISWGKLTLINLNDFVKKQLFSFADPDGRKSKNWGDIVDEAEARTPGHGVHMHEKLSSPSRKR